MGSVGWPATATTRPPRGGPIQRHRRVWSRAASIESTSQAGRSLQETPAMIGQGGPPAQPDTARLRPLTAPRWTTRVSDKADDAREDAMEEVIPVGSGGVLGLIIAFL